MKFEITIEKLVSLASLRYNLFCKIAKNEIKNNSIEPDILNHLAVLETKEDELWENLKSISEDEDEIDVFYFEELDGLPKEQEKIIIERLNRSTEEIANEFLSEADKGNEIFEQIRKEAIDIPYIIEVQKKIDKEKNKKKKAKLIIHKYNYIFMSRTLDKELICLEYNPHNLILLDSALNSEVLGIEEKEYSDILQDIVFDMIQELIIDAQTETLKSLEKFKLKFLLKKINYQDLLEFRELLDYLCLEKPNDKQLQKINKTINNIINKKKSTSEIEDPTALLKESNLESLESLIKLEELILENILNNDFKNLENFVYLEQELLQKIYANTENEEIITSIINDYTGFFLNDKQKETFIKRRLKSTHNQIDNHNYSNKTYRTINQNHMLETLISFYKQSKGKESIYKQVFYENFFSEYSLTQDLIVSQGNPDNIIIPSSKQIAQLIGSKEVLYSYDKDQQLYDLGNNTIKEINTIKHAENTEHNQAYLEFLGVKLENIFRNISSENVESLMDNLKKTDKKTKVKSKKIN